MKKHFNLKGGLLVLPFLLLFLIPLVSAGFGYTSVFTAENIGTFKQRDCIDLIQTCSNCSYINITSVAYPDGSLAISGEYEMTKAGTFYNYTYCLTDDTGDYAVNGYGDLDSSNEVWSYYFTVTPSGEGHSSSFFWIILALGFGLVIFGFWKEDYAITVLGSFALVFVGLYLLFYGVDGFKGPMTDAIGIVTLVIAGYIMVKLGIDWVQEEYNAY